MKIGSVEIAGFAATMGRGSGPVLQNQSIRVNGGPLHPDPGPASGSPGATGEITPRPSVVGAEKNEPDKESGYGASSRITGQAGREVAEDRSGEQLSRQERAELTALKQRDRAVRSHEQAHRAAGAGLVTGATSYSFQRGPDGRRYAVGGEVQIDTSKESTPEATIIKMSKIKRAALAPTDPSIQDQKVAALADKLMTRARQELHAREEESPLMDRPSVNLVV